MIDLQNIYLGGPLCPCAACGENYAEAYMTHAPAHGLLCPWCAFDLGTAEIVTDDDDLSVMDLIEKWDQLYDELHATGFFTESESE
jgi:hypothetical protein